MPDSRYSGSTKLSVCKNKLPPKRVHQKGHWKDNVLPKTKSAAKDLATPHDPPSSILNRLRQRRFRQKHAKPIHVFLLSKGMRSAIHARDGRRPPGLRRTEWAMQRLPTNLPSKLQHRPKDHTWNLVLSKTGRVSQPTVPPVDRTGRVPQPTGSVSVSRHLCTHCCAVCGTPDPSFCWCGASLVSTMNDTAYEQLADFFYNPRNPISTDTDPADQRALQKAFFDMANKETVGAPPMIVLGGTCLYLALVGKPDSMPHVQQALLAADCKALRQSLEHVDKGELFRGGQRPYSPGKSGLPTALRSFYHNLGSDILPLMNNLQRLRSSTSRAPVVFDLVERVANDTSIKCFGPYFKKRFLEVLCLMGGVRLGGFKLEDGELDFAAAVFPIADNSARGLKRIFPAATSDHLRRQGIRTLCRSMAVHGNKISFCMMHTMLCFKQKQDAGFLSWD